MRIIIKWATLTLAIYLIARYVGAISITEPKTAIFAALALGLLNALVRPILKFLTLPINILTFGFFSLILNGFMLTIVPKFVNGFTVKSFWWAVLAAGLITLITSILNSILIPDDED